MTASPRFRAALLFPLLVLAAGVSCGDDSDSPTATPSPTATQTEQTSTPSPTPSVQSLPLMEFPALYNPSELWTVPASGVPSLVMKASSSVESAWSPDETQLAIAVLGSPVQRLWLISADGHARSYDLPGSPGELQWSPDSKSVATAITPGRDRQDLVVIDESGTVHQLDESSLLPPESAAFFSISGWLPDGRLLAGKYPDASGQILAYDPQTGESAAFTDAPVQAPADLSISPDGALVAVVTYGGTLRCPGEGDGILLVSLDGSGERQLLSGLCGVIASPVWSPDGSRLAYMAFDTADRRGAFIVDAQTGASTRLSENLDQPLAWRSDNEMLAWRYGCYGCDGPPPSVITLSTDGAVTTLSDHVPSAVTEDGRLLALVLEDGLHVLDLASGSDRLVQPAVEGWSINSPEWSPHGNMLTFARYQQAGTRTFQIAYDGSAFKQRGDYAEDVRPSPDDQWSVRMERDLSSGQLTTLLVKRNDSPNEVPVAIDGQPVDLSWAPDSTRFLVTGDGTSWLVSADGTDVRPIAILATYLTPGEWSPDGRYFFVRTDTQLAVVDIDTETSLSVTDKGWINSATWAADSQSLAFIGADAFLTNRDAFAVNADGSGFHTIYRAADEAGASLSPGGDVAVICTFEGMEAHTYLVDPNTQTQLHELTPIGPFEFAWSPDGKHVASTGWGGASANGLYVVDVDTGEVKLITTGGGNLSHLRWLDNDTIGFDVGIGGGP